MLVVNQSTISIEKQGAVTLVTESVRLEASSGVFAKFISSFDFASPSRTEWRNAVCGTERERLQTALLTMATDAFSGTERDQLGIYKAAHSVLPLKGSNLRHLADLLTRYPDDVTEWLDVFVEALDQPEASKSELAGRVLQTLHNHVMAVGDTGTVDRRLFCACYQVYRLGYRPSWILEMVKEVEEEIAKRNGIIQLGSVLQDIPE